MPGYRVISSDNEWAMVLDPQEWKLFGHLWKVPGYLKLGGGYKNRLIYANHIERRHLDDSRGKGAADNHGIHIASEEYEASLRSMASTILTEKPLCGEAAYEFGLGRSTSAAMREIETTIVQVAPTDIPVLLTGESGTGKKRVAQQIHRLSLRHNEPLVKIACTSLDGDAVSTYFRAVNDGSRKGFGTLLLDEISELSPATQRSLLHSLPDTDASLEEETAGPRLISCTTLDLSDETRAGRFRAELYFRINGVCLRLPPLRQRKEDIPPLLELFLTKHSTLMNKPRPRIEKEDLVLLSEYAWPGNIRELENAAKAMVAVNDTKSILAKLDPGLDRPSSAVGTATGSILKSATRAASRRTERELILHALTKTRWNRKRAAQDLQISYKSLLSKLKQIGVTEPDTV